MAVRRTLGDQYNSTLDRLYRKTMHFILTILTIGFRQVMSEVAAEANQKAQQRAINASMHAAANAPQRSNGQRLPESSPTVLAPGAAKKPAARDLQSPDVDASTQQSKSSSNGRTKAPAVNGSGPTQWQSSNGGAATVGRMSPTDYGLPGNRLPTNCRLESPPAVGQQYLEYQMILLPGQAL